MCLRSKQNQTIDHLKDIKSEPNVRALFQQICDLVQREELNASLISLELLDSSGSTNSQAFTSSANAESTGAHSLPMFVIQIKLPIMLHLKFHLFCLSNGELNPYGPVCQEPLASKSPLARQVCLLLENMRHSDLEFILPPDAEVNNHSGHLVKAHRVILASRCRWFHRALLSGMREAIDR